MEADATQGGREKWKLTPHGGRGGEERERQMEADATQGERGGEGERNGS